MPDWDEYQERVADFFRSIGMSAETNATVKGVRTSHDVDVLVRSSHAGFEVMWVVECKYWSTKVSKLHVLALREIVSDTGADRGLLLSESGFQSGAIDAANLTNVRATSLAQCQSDSASQIAIMRLNDLFDRSAIARAAYWEMPKDIRIKNGLTTATFDGNWFNGEFVTNVVDEIVSKCIRGIFPFKLESNGSWILPRDSTVIHDIRSAVEVAERLILELEARLVAATGSSIT